MLASLSWLKRYVEIPVDTRRLVEDLTMVGLNVESVHETGLREKRIVVGKVLEASKHPDADKLSLCRVEVGGGNVLEIVCGAPNVASGQTVPVALPGATLPNGLKIRKSKIRGRYSEGMICSEIELGLGEDATGIMVLPDDLEAGAPVAEVLFPPDEIIEIEVTPNRPDLLSHVGIAREIAALYGKELRLPGAKIPPEPAPESFSIEVENPRDCPRYTGRIVRGVRVGPSPPWLASALESVGLHSINNVVDVTNFVMLELGHPLHAFDLELLKGDRIVVRRAEPGEVLDALDGERYELGPGHLVIADARVPVALAGVIGGAPTAVTGRTVDLLLESACFDPVLVRRTRKELGLDTEASYRFERGTDREICKLASDRACSLIVELAGGEPGGFIDVYPGRTGARTIHFDLSETKRLLGVALTAREVADLLTPLGFGCTGGEAGGMEVSVPGFRADVVERADLVEEIARRYGYDRIGRGKEFRCTTYSVPDELDEVCESILDHFASRGFTEVLTTSFSDGSEAELLGWAKDDPRTGNIRLRNPLVSTQTCLRTSLVPGMLEVVRRNLDQGLRRIEICQIGKIFIAGGDGGGLPEERLLLALVMTRQKEGDFWFDSKRAPDLFDIKREIELLSSSFKVDLRHDFCYDFDRDLGRFRYVLEGKTVIEGALAGPAVSKRFDFEQPVWYAEIDLAEFLGRRVLRPRFVPVSEFPPSKRDLSLVVGRGTTYERIEKLLVKSGGGLVESIKLFDVFRGGNLPEGSTAYGIRIRFRSRERTLTDTEIDKIVGKMLKALKEELGVELRSRT